MIDMIVKTNENSALIKSISLLNTTINKTMKELDKIFIGVEQEKKKIFYNGLKTGLLEEQEILNNCFLKCRNQPGQQSNLSNCYVYCINITAFKIIELEFKYKCLINENFKKDNDPIFFTSRKLTEDIYKRFL